MSGTSATARPEYLEAEPSPSSETDESVWGQMFEPVCNTERIRWTRPGWLVRHCRRVACRVMHLISLVWFDFKVIGRHHLPDGGFLLASNHSSHFDVVALIRALGERGGTLYMLGARDYFFRSRLNAWFFRTFFRILPLDRHGDFGSGLSLAQEVMKDGHPLLIYPEGTRSSDGQVHSFRPGVGLLGVELGVPIVPCLIQGTFTSLPKRKWWPKRAQVSVKFGQPMDMDDFRAQLGEMSRSRLYRQISSDLYRRVVSLADASSSS